jgi:hypothetical protein
LPSPVGHQDVTAAVNPHEDPLGCKISTSENYVAKKRNQNVDPYSGGNASCYYQSIISNGPNDDH